MPEEKRCAQQVLAKTAHRFIRDFPDERPIWLCSAPLRRAATKFNWWPTVPGAKSSDQLAIVGLAASKCRTMRDQIRYIDGIYESRITFLI